MFKWLPFGKQKKRTRQRVTIVNATDDNFEVQVLRRSYKTPVMVDFWAAWCGPCRRLGPLLEKLADAEESGFVLAKLNTEHNPGMSGRYQIRSIPHVKMFRNGQPIGEFTGALSEPTVRDFITQKTVAYDPPTPKRRKPVNPAQTLSQAENHLQRGRGFEAYLLLRDFPAAPESERAATLLPLARFLVDMRDGDGLTGDEALDDRQLDAAEALEARDPAAALEHLFGVRDMLRPADEVPVEDVIAGLLALLGPEHALAAEYAPRLAEPRSAE